MKCLKVIVNHTSRAAQASNFTNAHALPNIHWGELKEGDSALVFNAENIALVTLEKKQKIYVTVDFASGSAAHRRMYGGGKKQMMAKAMGFNGTFVPHILDATAGLGRDAFVFAVLGAEVTMLERSPVINILLQDGFERAKHNAESNCDEQLLSILTRMRLIACSSHTHLQSNTSIYDVIYLDPMFPERKKSALVKKEMRVLHDIIGEDIDADKLLDLALARAKYRVVVKRPRIAPPLAGKPSTYQLTGKSSRFDIYAIKAIPSSVCSH